MNTADGPDFICLGMPKAGTGWLYDQLAVHPDFWMPPVKELSYLHRERPALNFAKENPELGAKHKKPVTVRRRRGTDERLVSRVALDARDIAFLNRAREKLGEPRQLDFYASLFRFKGNLLSGDITPQYCKI